MPAQCSNSHLVRLCFIPACVLKWGACWQELTVVRHPELMVLQNLDEDTEGVMEATPAQLMALWLNHHLAAAGWPMGGLPDLAVSLQDASAFCYLLERLQPDSGIVAGTRCGPAQLYLLSIGSPFRGCQCGAAGHELGCQSASPGAGKTTQCTYLDAVTKCLQYLACPGDGPSSCIGSQEDNQGRDM